MTKYWLGKCINNSNYENYLTVGKVYILSDDRVLVDVINPDSKVVKGTIIEAFERRFKIIKSSKLFNLLYGKD